MPPVTTLPPPSPSALAINTDDADACGIVRDVLSRIGDKWSVVAIVMLGQSSLRFGELRRRGHGVSQRMLTHTLRQLERDGIVWRKATPTVPVTVEYGLTDLGRNLLCVLQPFFQWTVDNAQTIEASRATFDARKSAEDPNEEGPPPPADRP
jgi:DNA-binding HxlR family transcriptional regulator